MTSRASSAPAWRVAARLRPEKLPRFVRRTAMNVPPVRRAYYRVRNRRAFTDLWQHDMMLADRVRVDAYARAIAAHVTSGDVVLDLGTGTGILAFLAARRGTKAIYALDHSPVINQARELARVNSVDGVQFFNTHSGRFNAPEPVDVIVHEQMGDALFDERMVENVLDLRTRVLKPGGRILPSRFEFHIDPVQLHDRDSVPYSWQHTALHGLDFGALRKLEDGDRPTHRFRFLQPVQFAAPLCDRAPLLTIDLEQMDRPDLPQTLEFSRRVIRDGRLDGFCVSFVARFDDDLCLDTWPFAEEAIRPYHWSQPLLRVECGTVAAGDELRFALRATDLALKATWRWSYSVIEGGMSGA